jgi:hypothetical protein
LWPQYDKTPEFCLARIGPASVTAATEQAVGNPHPPRIEKETGHGPTGNLPALSCAATLPKGIWCSDWFGGRLDGSGATLARPPLIAHAARSNRRQQQGSNLRPWITRMLPSHRPSTQLCRSELSRLCVGLHCEPAGLTRPGLPHRKLRNWRASGRSDTAPSPATASSRSANPASA